MFTRFPLSGQTPQMQLQAVPVIDRFFPSVQEQFHNFLHPFPILAQLQMFPGQFEAISFTAAIFSAALHEHLGLRTLMTSSGV